MLDGRTKETAIQSVAALLHCSKDELGHYFSTVSFDDSSLPPEEALFRHLSKNFDIPKTTTARYFHGCRAIGSGSYKVRGIRTKSEIYPELRQALGKLSEGIPNEGEYPHAESVVGKENLGIGDEGPFASLYLQLTLSPPGHDHNYLEAPELVEDIAGDLCGANYHLIIERFKRLSRSYVIHFEDAASDYQISKFLYFTYLVWSGETLEDAVETAMCFHNRLGKAVPPEAILSIEEVSK